MQKVSAAFLTLIPEKEQRKTLCTESLLYQKIKGKTLYYYKSPLTKPFTLLRSQRLEIFSFDFLMKLNKNQQKISPK